MRTKSLKTRKVLAYLQANPSTKLTEVAKKFKMTPSYVYKLKSSMEIDKRNAIADEQYKLYFSTSNKPLTKSSTKEEAVDKVNHPPHYKVGGIETIDFIEAKKLNYNLGNVIKYITRADHKGSRDEDLQKALWYLNREVMRK